MSKPFIAVLMGADSDLSTVQVTVDVLKKLDIPVEIRIYSSHHTPEAIRDYITNADKRGASAFIACSDFYNHLPDTVASLTIKPVIALPVTDLLLGTEGVIERVSAAVHTPSGVPVASVAAGKHGAKNAGYLAARIIALNDKELENRLKMARQAKTEKVLANDAALQQKLTGQ